MKSTECPFYKILNMDLCKCECTFPTPSCSQNERFDEETCQCVCNYEGCSSLTEPSASDNLTCGCFGMTSYSCPTMSHFNGETCACDCDEPVECSSPMQFNNETCRCECQTFLTCSPNRKLNAETCACECIARENCISGYIWNASLCSCECITEKCPRGWGFDRTSCTCVPNGCAGGYYSGNGGRCEPLKCENARNAEECRYLRCDNSARQCTWVQASVLHCIHESRVVWLSHNIQKTIL